MSENNIPIVSELMDTNVKNKINHKYLDNFDKNIFQKFEEGALFIVNEVDILLGIITDGDVRKNLDSSIEHNFDAIMTKSPKVIYEYESSSIALRILRESEINILPVVDNDKKIKGFITLHMLLDNFSPERLYLTGVESEIDDNEERHLARYSFALNFLVKDGLTLDCACGSGYGSRILKSKSNKVLGVDISEDAINFANKNNALNGIEFMQENIDFLEFEKNSLDNVISIETLEHVPYDVFINFLEKIESWLKDGGVFIGSSPMLRYKDGKPYITNPYHINEMPRDEFIDAINDKLKNFQIHYYYQSQDSFYPLCKENTGFCIVVARKGKE